MTSNVPTTLKKEDVFALASKNSFLIPVKWKPYVIPARTEVEDHSLHTTSYQFLPPDTNIGVTDRKFHYGWYGEHRKRIRNVKQKVDNSSPFINSGVQIKPIKKWIEEMSLLNSNKISEHLLEQLMIISNSKGMIDNSPPLMRTNTEIPRGVARRQHFIEVSRENRHIFASLKKAKPVYKTKQLLSDWKHNERAIKGGCKFPLVWNIKEPDPDEPEDIEEMVNGEIVVSKPRLPKCYIDVWSSGAPLGRIVIRLRSDIVPQTAANFLCYCTGQLGMSYKGCEFHHVVTDTLMKSGDVVYKNGTSGRSIYGPTFNDENFYLKHWCQGIVSMANSGPNTNNSQFFITMKPLPTLDEQHVVFGKVIRGMDTIIRMNNFATVTGRPKRKMVIKDCGVLY